MTRELAWKDTFVEKLVQEITDDSCEGSSVLLDTDYNYIALELTEEQWTILFSALKTGADLSYGDMSHEVVWWFLKGVECAMSFCSKMIECIETDEDTREAIIQGMIAELLADPVQAAAFTGMLGQLGVALSGGNTQIGAPNEPLAAKEFGDCTDEEVLYGQCYAWVVALSEIAEDVLQWIELATNDEELASLLVDNIPALGALPASVLETALWLQETVADTFFSADDTTTREYWACKIYCEVVMGDCSLTFENAHNAYANGLTDFTPPAFSSDLATWLAWYVDLVTLDDIEIVGAMHLFIMTVIERLGNIFGSSWRTIEIALDGATPTAPACEDCDCTIPSRSWNWIDMDGVTVYPITDRVVGSGYPNFPSSTHWYATGNIANGTLPQDIEGFDADCEYNWFECQLWYVQGSGSASKTATIAVYSDAAHTNLLSSFTVNVPHTTYTTVHEQFPTPITGYSTYYIVVSIPPHGSAYGFYQSASLMSTDEP